MIRTQIYIPEKTHKQLKQLAKNRRATFAEIIRGFIDIGLERPNKNSAIDYSGKKAMRGIAKLNFSGPQDLSKNHDQYLYDEPYQGHAK